MGRPLSLLTLIIACVTLTAWTAAAAGARTISLRLDAYSPTTGSTLPAVTSSSVLRRGVLYVATAQGTFSFYAAVDYTDPQVPFKQVCGTPLAAPLLASAGGIGKVGDDPEFDFARLSKASCTGPQRPRHWTNFQANDGAGWAHPQPAVAHPVARPTANHAYDYGLVGRGRPVSFRLLDSDTRDDYGAVEISIRPATHAACAGNGYRAFGLTTASACLSRTVAGPAPAAPKLHPVSLNQSPVLHVLRNRAVPTSPNQELPSGALTARAFAALTTASPSAVRATANGLLARGFVSAAISQHLGVGLPLYTSTAVLYRNPAAAQNGLTFELALDSLERPAGSTVTVAPAAESTGAESITFTPGTPTGTGGEELVVRVGDFVDDLRAVQMPGRVTLAQCEALLNTVTGPTTASAAGTEFGAPLGFGSA